MSCTPKIGSENAQTIGYDAIAALLGIGNEQDPELWTFKIAK